MHMEHPYFFGEGSRVERGDHVGYVGKTGNASGYHLHLIVFKRDENVNWVTDSNRLNPQRFFPGVPFTGDTSVLLLFCIVLARCETAEKHPEDSENVNSQTMDSTENNLDWMESAARVWDIYIMNMMLVFMELNNNLKCGWIPRALMILAGEILKS